MSQIENQSQRNPIIVFAGNVGAGKTSLIQSLSGARVGDVKKKFFIGVYLVRREDVKKASGFRLEASHFLFAEAPKVPYQMGFERALELADLVLLVIDVSEGRKGLEKAIKMIDYLKKKKIEFAIVFSKVDKLDSTSAEGEIKDLVDRAKWYAEEVTINVVSASAVAENGLTGLIGLLNEWTKHKAETKIFTLGYSLKAPILQVRKVLGHGRLLFVVVLDGILRKTDTVLVLCPEGSRVATIKDLWTPLRPANLLLAEGPYDKPEEIRAGHGVLVALEDGDLSPYDMDLRRVEPSDDIQQLVEQADKDITAFLKRVDELPTTNRFTY